MLCALAAGLHPQLLQVMELLWGNLGSCRGQGRARAAATVAPSLLRPRHVKAHPYFGISRPDGFCASCRCMYGMHIPQVLFNQLPVDENPSILLSDYAWPPLAWALGRALTVACMCQATTGFEQSAFPGTPSASTADPSALGEGASSLPNCLSTMSQPCRTHGQIRACSVSCWDSAPCHAGLQGIFTCASLCMALY